MWLGKMRDLLIELLLLKLDIVLRVIFRGEEWSKKRNKIFMGYIGERIVVDHRASVVLRCAMLFSNGKGAKDPA